VGEAEGEAAELEGAAMLELATALDALEFELPEHAVSTPTLKARPEITTRLRFMRIVHHGTRWPEPKGYPNLPEM